MRIRVSLSALWCCTKLTGTRAFVVQKPHFRPGIKHTASHLLSMSTMSDNNKHNKSDDEPLISPVIAEKRSVPVPSTAAFVATLLVLPVFAVTVLPLSILYQAFKALMAPFQPKKDPPKIDSGYVVESSQIIPREQRKYDIVVLGATGFTGHLAVRHLAKTYGCSGNKVRWAIAGRSQAKLDQVKKILAKELGMEAMHEIDTIIVDTSVASSMPALVEQTRVVASTAGPYALYGSPVVEFCAKFGTHYVDITGEVDWVKAMAHQWNNVARETGAKLISFCGHDSIPWDLSVMKLQAILKEECNDNLVSATFWDESVGGAPGGTFATALSAIDGHSIKHPVKEMDPFVRLPDGPKSEYIAKSTLPLVIAKAHSPWDGPSSKRWTMPFIMAMINSEVVKWSHALRSEGSKKLTYKESFIMPDFKTAFMGFMGFNMFGVALFNPLTGYFIRKMIPKPGEGPSMDDMEHKHFLCVYGEGVGEHGNRAESIFYSPQDAGCLETSRMLVESGLCMALQESELPSRAAQGGFWTPSTALADVLEKRLLDIGMQWSAKIVPAKA